MLLLTASVSQCRAPYPHPLRSADQSSFQCIWKERQMRLVSRVATSDYFLNWILMIIFCIVQFLNCPKWSITFCLILGDIQISWQQFISVCLCISHETDSRHIGGVSFSSSMSSCDWLLQHSTGQMFQIMDGWINEERCTACRIGEYRCSVAVTVYTHFFIDSALQIYCKYFKVSNLCVLLPSFTVCTADMGLTHLVLWFVGHKSL